MAGGGSPFRTGSGRGIISETCARLLAAGLFVWAAVWPGSAEPKAAARATRRAACAPVTLPPASTDGFERIVKPFVAANCVPCHGNEKHKKDLNFEAFTSVAALIDDRDRWDEVVLKLRDREMPPDDEPQPPEHQRQAVAGLAGARARAHRPADAARSRPRHRAAAEPRGIQQHGQGSARRRHASCGRLPAGRLRLRFRQHRGRAVAVARADGEVPVRGASGSRATRSSAPPPLQPTLTRLRSDGRRAGEARTFPGAVRRHRAQPSERVSRGVPRAGRGRVRRPRRRSAACVPPAPSRSRCAVGRRAAGRIDASRSREVPRRSTTIARTSAARRSSSACG